MYDKPQKHPVVVIGGGFTALAAAYELARSGIPVRVLEKEEELGGLAGSFEFSGGRLEKFYHHWFNSDKYIIQLIEELGARSQLLYSTTKTGMYWSNKFYKLSTPLDVLCFNPLSFWNRLRLGRLSLYARRIKNWKLLESLTAQEWLLKQCGPEVYRVVWEPLLRGKFGAWASEISAVWFWNKLLLRGGSRDKTGRETLVYFQGGFSALAERIAAEITATGGSIQTRTAVEGLIVQNGQIQGIRTSQGIVNASAVIATPALPIIAEWMEPHISHSYADSLRRINYLANVCLVLILSESLSDIYWLNVNDPEFPFIGVIEHTNFQVPIADDAHVVYLPMYLPATDEHYCMDNESLYELSISHLKRMFPKFDRLRVRKYFVWKAPYAQPVVERYYSRLIPAPKTPIKGFYITSMAQIYPEDRGTNYAVCAGRHIGRMVAHQMTRDLMK